jgi:hypothetical protein
MRYYRIDFTKPDPEPDIVGDRPEVGHHGAPLAWKQADDLVPGGIDRRSVKAYSVLIDGLKDGAIKAGIRRPT